MNDGVEAFWSQLQKELGLSIGPKDPLLALWVSQKGLLEQNAAQQQSLNAGLQAAQNSTALLLEEAARMNAAAVRKVFEEGVARMEQALATGRQIAWLSLAASVVALTAGVCAIFVHVTHCNRIGLKKCERRGVA